MATTTTAYENRFARSGPNEILDWLSSEHARTTVMSTSFGIYSAAFLHLVTRRWPDMPVIWIDTGYLPRETYLFAERLTSDLNLNVRVYQSNLSPARMEAIYGRLWESREVEKLEKYDLIRKVLPMKRALGAEGAEFWLAGVRRVQTENRKHMNQFSEQHGVTRVAPILDWTTKTIFDYISSNELPFHPLLDKGYATVGDAHLSRPMTLDDEHERSTRFHGLKEECGLHLEVSDGLLESLNSSAL